MERKCPCNKEITRIFAQMRFNTALEGGGLATQPVGWEWQLTGHCLNGCSPVDLGVVRFLGQAARLYQNAIIREATNVTR